MEKKLTLIVLLALTIVSCKKNEDVPTPQPVISQSVNTQAQANLLGYDCSTLRGCLIDDWQLDSIKYYNVADFVFISLPTHSGIGMILNDDGTMSNATLTGTWTYDESNNMLETTVGGRGTPHIQGDNMIIDNDPTPGTLGNDSWTNRVWYYSRRQ